MDEKNSEDSQKLNEAVDLVQFGSFFFNHLHITNYIYKLDERAAGVRFVYHEFDFRPIGRHEVLLLINHKNYDFREKKNSQVIRQGENLHFKIDKRCINLGVCTLFLW